MSNKEWKQMIGIYTPVVASTLGGAKTYMGTRIYAAVRKFAMNNDGRFVDLKAIQDCVMRKVDIASDEGYHLFKWFWTELLGKC